MNKHKRIATDHEVDSGTTLGCGALLLMIPFTFVATMIASYTLGEDAGTAVLYTCEAVIAGLLIYLFATRRA